MTKAQQIAQMAQSKASPPACLVDKALEVGKCHGQMRPHQALCSQPRNVAYLQTWTAAGSSLALSSHRHAKLLACRLCLSAAAAIQLGGMGALHYYAMSAEGEPHCCSHSMRLPCAFRRLCPAGLADVHPKEIKMPSHAGVPEAQAFTRVQSHKCGRSMAVRGLVCSHYAEL